MKHILELCKALPMDHPIFLQLLQQHGMLPNNTRGIIESKETNLHKADYYIQHVIKASTDLYLPKLLQVIEEYTKKLSDTAPWKLDTEIMTELYGTFSNNYDLIVRVIVNCTQ